MRVVAAVCFASLSGCVAISHEQLIEEDTDGDGIADADEPLELVGAGIQHFDTVAFADLDDDGFDDLLLGNRSNSEEWGRPFRGGSVVIVYGGTERPDSPLELAGASAELVGPAHQTGGVTFAPGDYDGDGKDDAAVAVSGGGFNGSLFVLYGSSERLIGRPFIETVAPAMTGSGLGIRAAGDLDGDGCDDLFVHREDGAHVVRGSPERFRSGPIPVSASFLVTSATHFAGLASSGDLDGDGARDVVVGEELLPDNPFRANIFYGPIEWRAHAFDEADGAIALEDGDWASATTGFDLDADGRDELFVSSMYPNVDRETFLIFGRSSRLVGLHEVADVTSVAIPQTDRLYAIGLVPKTGDADGDGSLDLLLGAPMFEERDGPIGRVYRYHGPIHPDTTVTPNEVWDGRVVEFSGSGALAGRTYEERLGSDVAQDGDFDGDGFADALMAAPSNVIPYGGRRVRLVWGAARSLR